LVALLDRLRKKPLAGTKGGVARSYPAGKRMYCIGDIHGRADLLEALLYLGDFIDRGDDSKRVIDILISQPLPDFEYIYLLGNHEQSMLDFLIDAGAMAGWLHWGGRETLLSYGINVHPTAASPDLDELGTLLEHAMPAEHLDFLRNCTLSHSEGSYYFVHAGIRPGVKLERQDYQDQLWIRDAFTRSTRDHGAVVVHGHSISEKVEFLPNRIGIDTGAYYSGVLTCLVLEGEDQRLLQTGGPS
jgi:serine/threonine protein phosphatase 1